MENKSDAALFMNDLQGKPRVIAKGVEVDVKLNTFVIEVLKETVEYLIERYGHQEFLKMSKEVVEGKRQPKQGMELNITMLSAVIVAFEHLALESGKTRDLTDDEMEIYKAKVKEFEETYGTKKPTGS